MTIPQLPNAGTPGPYGPPPPPPRTLRQHPPLSATVRLIGSAVIAILAVLTLVLLGPTGEDHGSERDQIWIEDTANQSRTGGAPQQAVVNGWTGNALLGLVSEQIGDAARPDQRPAALLTLGVLLGALHVATPPIRPGKSSHQSDGCSRRSSGTPPGPPIA